MTISNPAKWRLISVTIYLLNIGYAFFAHNQDYLDGKRYYSSYTLFKAILNSITGPIELVIDFISLSPFSILNIINLFILLTLIFGLIFYKYSYLLFAGIIMVTLQIIGGIIFLNMIAWPK